LTTITRCPDWRFAAVRNQTALHSRVDDRISNREGRKLLFAGAVIAGICDISRKCFEIVRQEQAVLTDITGLRQAVWR
jgi:hypothetical protein